MLKKMFLFKVVIDVAIQRGGPTIRNHTHQVPYSKRHGSVPRVVESLPSVAELRRKIGVLRRTPGGGKWVPP